MLGRVLNRETVSYLIFGILTTVINYVVFWLAVETMGEEQVLSANAVAWVAAVIFAYFTNKLFVFESRSFRWNVLRRELPAFLGARLFSFVFEEAALFVCVEWLDVGRWALFGIGGVMIAKAVLNVVVILMNYVLSKFMIFKAPEK